jgi:prolyl-tRNA synthetase
MRAREFTMKDAYSFHLDQDSLLEGYGMMRAAYDRIFTRLQLEFRIVQADPGEMGGNRSEEFHVLAESGEDAIAYCESDGFAANVETVAITPTDEPAGDAEADLELVPTPDVRSIEDLSSFMEISPAGCLKTLLVAGAETPAVALLLCGHHELNRIKAEAIEGVARPLRMLRGPEVLDATGCEPGFLGPKDLEIPIYADQAVAGLRDFVCGANQADHHLRGVNWGRDLPLPSVVDLRNVVAGDPSPSGGGSLAIARGIEVGHIFQLGSKYSDSMEATVLGSDGKACPIQMGCYGIGVTRVVAAAIEQNNDARGIIWPDAIAPFDIVLIPINLDKSYRVKEATDSLYEELEAAGFDVLFDDRPQRPGVKFADADLLGIPHRLVIAEKAWDEGQIEYKSRRSPDTEMVPVANVTTFLSDIRLS